MNIGNGIRQIRMEKNISQGGLSKLVGISRTSLCSIELGHKRPSARNMTKICNALEIPECLIYFYGFEESDANLKKKKLYKVVYPAIMDMVRKLLLED